ncbi:MAG: type 4a pilus biogenesis protein PilO [Phycisphaeraceae bacterium]
MRFGIREAIFFLLLLATPVAVYFFDLEQRNARIDEAKEEYSQKQVKLKQLEAATRSITDLGQEIDKLSNTIEVFEAKLPAQREVEVILQQVWEMASRHELVPKSVRTDKPIDHAKYSELPIKMVIAGDFDGFYSFMLELERLSRITRLPQLKMKKVMTPSETASMEAELTLSIFFDSDDQGSKPGRSKL